MEYLHKLAIDLKNKPSGVPDYFACNVVKLIANGLYRMPLPIVLQGFFEEHKKVVRQYPFTPLTYRGFWGSQPFSKINKLFKREKKSPIQWGL